MNTSLTRLTSSPPFPANRVSFEFQHNVCGRSIYAEGTVDAVLFLAKKVLKLCLETDILFKF